MVVNSFMDRAAEIPGKQLQSVAQGMGRNDLRNLYSSGQGFRLNVIYCCLLLLLLFVTVLRLLFFEKTTFKFVL